MPRAQSYTKPNLNLLQNSALRLQNRIEKQLTFIQNYAGIYLPPRMARKQKTKLSRIHKALKIITELEYFSI